MPPQWATSEVCPDKGNLEERMLEGDLITVLTCFSQARVHVPLPRSNQQLRTPIESGHPEPHLVLLGTPFTPAFADAATSAPTQHLRCLHSAISCFLPHGSGWMARGAALHLCVCVWMLKARGMAFEQEDESWWINVPILLA